MTSNDGVLADQLRDGTIAVKVKSDGVFVVITAAENGGREVSFSQLEKTLAAKEIIDVDWGVARDALQAKNGEPMCVAPRRPNLDRNGSLRVEIAPDQLTANLIISPPLGGKPITVADAEAALRAAGVTEGINSELLAGAVRDQRLGGSFAVARGRAVVNGNDGYIDFKFDVSGRRAAPVELGDGRIDFHDLHLVQNVNAGQVLAVRVPPTEGIAGVTVTGRQLPAKPGKDVRLPKGKGTEIGSDPGELVAAVSGQVVQTGGSVNVLSVYEVKGDVDFNVGNIDFVGSVHVRGTVHTGFTIRASGNVSVDENVEAAAIISEGDVVIKRGVLGADHCLITALGSVAARSLQQCEVQAGQDVIVEEAIMSSKVQAGHKVEVRGSKGRIVGGVTRAGEEVCARTIGARLGTHTEIEVGTSPVVRTELTRISDELQRKEKEFDQVTKGLKVIKAVMAQGRRLTANDPERAGQLALAENQLAADLAELRERRERLDEQVTSGGRGFVKGLDTVHPGVKITIGHCVTLVGDEQPKGLFYLGDGEIRLGTA